MHVTSEEVVLQLYAEMDISESLSQRLNSFSSKQQKQKSLPSDPDRSSSPSKPAPPREYHAKIRHSFTSAHTLVAKMQILQLSKNVVTVKIFEKTDTQSAFSLSTGIIAIDLEHGQCSQNFS